MDGGSVEAKGQGGREGLSALVGESLGRFQGTWLGGRQPQLFTKSNKNPIDIKCAHQKWFGFSFKGFAKVQHRQSDRDNILAL